MRFSRCSRLAVLTLLMVVQLPRADGEEEPVTSEMRGFSEEQKLVLLDKHNEFRASRRASNMRFMKWDPALERSAQRWADSCVFAHSDKPYRTGSQGYGYVGENLFATSAYSFFASSVIQSWFNEERYYNYNDMTCTPGQMCGHYTQVVWAQSGALGCAVQFCERLSQARGIYRGFIVVCQYGPGGNYIGSRPFRMGPACSECSANEPYCIEGMCSEETSGNGITDKSTSPRHPPYAVMMIIPALLVLSALGL